MNDPSRSSDEELADSLSAPDDHAIAALAGRYSRPLYDFALRATLDPAVAAAVTRSSIEYLQTSTAARPRETSVRAWVFAYAQEQVLAVAGDRGRGPEVKVSPGDKRFVQAPPGTDRDVALWAWQAARSLRPRDYCLLDLTLRRGIAPEDVMGPQAQGRGGVYAALGRARGGFDEAFLTTALYFRGRQACAELAELVGGSGASMRVGIRRQVASHVEGCDICQSTLDSLPAAAQVFADLHDVDIPPELPEQIQAGMAGAVAAGQLALDDVAPTSVEPAAGALTEFARQPDEEQIWSPDQTEQPDSTTEFAPAGTAGEEGSREDIEAEDEATRRLQRRAAGVQFGGAYRGRGMRFGRFGSGLLWSYVWLGVSTAVAIYLGIAVADSLRDGGGASGEVRLGTGFVRNIPCDSGPLRLNQGTSELVQFDADSLQGFEIESIAISAESQSNVSGLTATRRDGSGLELRAAPVQSSTARQDEFLLQIEWQRGEEAGRSNCSVVVNVAPSTTP